jgi:ATP-binding cassette, subfamily B, bacterial
MARNIGLFSYALRLAFTASPGLIVLQFGLILLQGATLPLGIYISKLALDTISSGSSVVIPALLWAVCLGMGVIAEPFSSLVAGSINEKMTAHVTELLMNKAGAHPDLTPFESPVFYNEIQLLSRLAPYRPLNTLASGFTLLRDGVSVLGVLGLLGTLAWWLPLALFALTYPHVARGVVLQNLSWNVLVGSQGASRAMDYFRSLLLTDAYAKEVRLFGFGGFVIARFRQAFNELHGRMNADRRRQAVQPIFTALLSLFSSVAAFVWVMESSRGGALPASGILVFVQALYQLQLRLGDVTVQVGLMTGHLQFFDSLERFLEGRPAMQTGTRAVSFGRIEFQNVSFQYPDGRTALREVSCVIEPGKTIALVGENGAGKTSFVKLLCRFYDPSQGRILVDGMDLRDLDITQWREQLSAVFQDFGKYSLTLRENIALGHLESLRSDEVLTQAATFSDLNKTIAALPNGFDTQLGKAFGGTDLSGGQWQKLAIARACVRSANLLILDEPTAALDPRAEYELYQQFAQLAHDKTVILVTHRLASVQMADRILVFNDGSIVEEGTHETLVSARGEYAQLYQLQARQFLE